jgi:hypothetical protein
MWLLDGTDTHAEPGWSRVHQGRIDLVDELTQGTSGALSRRGFRARRTRVREQVLIELRHAALADDAEERAAEVWNSGRYRTRSPVGLERPGPGRT